MSKLRLGLVVFLLLFTINATAAPAAGWYGLAAWVNKYPSEKLLPHGRSLLDQPVVASSIKQLLSKAELASLARYDVETPVRRSGDYLVIDKCLPHDCPAAMAMIVINIKSKHVWVGMFSRGEHRVSTVWYGTSDDYAVLPDSIRRDFLSRHGD